MPSDEPRSVGRRRLDVQIAARALDPLSGTNKAQTSPGPRRALEPNAVVLDDEPPAVVEWPHADPNVAGRRVSSDVRQGLLRHAKKDLAGRGGDVLAT